MKRPSIGLAATLLALCLAPATTSAAGAGNYFELTDAEPLIGSAQNVGGVAGTKYSSITGSLYSSADVDLFKFCAGGTRLVASTTSLGGGANDASDTTLVLFDSNGMGLLLAEDSKSSNYSSMTATGLTKGSVYYLAVTSFDNRPQNSGNDLFTLKNSANTYVGQWGPTNSNPLTGWTTSTLSNHGDYVVNVRNFTACG
jgi:hypothetical protein